MPGRALAVQRADFNMNTGAGAAPGVCDVICRGLAAERFNSSYLALFYTLKAEGNRPSIFLRQAITGILSSSSTVSASYL